MKIYVIIPNSEVKEDKTPSKQRRYVERKALDFFFNLKILT